jgi:hypothetical protein
MVSFSVREMIHVDLLNGTYTARANPLELRRLARKPSVAGRYGDPRGPSNAYKDAPMTPNLED